MKKILLGASGVLVLGLAAVAVLLQAGMVDVAADTPHSPTVYRQRSTGNRYGSGGTRTVSNTQVPH